MTTHKRKDDESGKEFSDSFYSDRFFYDESGWYYYTRGIYSDEFFHGPFLTKEEALNDCDNKFRKPNI